MIPRGGQEDRKAGPSLASLERAKKLTKRRDLAPELWCVWRVRAPVPSSGLRLAVRRRRRHRGDGGRGTGLPHPLVGDGHAVAVQAIAAGRVADVAPHRSGIHLSLRVIGWRRRHVDGLRIDRSRVHDSRDRGRDDGRADEKAADHRAGAPPTVPAAPTPTVAAAALPAVPAGRQSWSDKPERQNANERETDDFLHDHCPPVRQAQIHRVTLSTLGAWTGHPFLLFSMYAVPA